MTEDKAADSKNKTDIRERFSVRWIALGAAVIMIALLGAENMVWQFVSTDTRAFLQKAVVAAASPDLTQEQKNSLRTETLKRLAIPPVIGLALGILAAAVLSGFIAGIRSQSLWSGPVASVSGVLIAFIISGAISVSAMVAALFFALLALPGTVLAKYFYN